ncbi:MAG: hypothetical protein HS105_12435 [Chloracidobacterium sp.]|nr:hypothetical protein [Chloracidobacterium sp.]MCC6825724.1 hypothetical protein [Acidobacteriota bacterium]MCO5332877.1 hypothetical protein [Pyrinomonadaceae bacterium]
MSDTKNIAIAWSSSLSTLLTTAFSYDVVVTIVLPVVLFSIGKSVDVLIQIYLERSKRGGRR